jgi:hypothetical protein
MVKSSPSPKQKGAVMLNQPLISKVSKITKKSSSYFCMSASPFIFTVAAFFFLLASCGRIPVGVVPDETGAVEIHSCLQTSAALSKTLAKLATTSDSLIIVVTGPDIDTLRFSRIFDVARAVHSDTLTKIPAGSDRQIRIYTVDRSGSIVHADTNSHRYIRIDPNTTTPLNVVLMPAMGSIYLQLENIPTKVDSVIASFASDDQRLWTVRAKRSTKINLSLDKIPNALQGVLTVVAVDSIKDTLYQARKEITFNAVKMETVSLNFSASPSNLTLNMTVVLPGVTAASGNMAASDTSAIESGDLLITEIMYAANDSEYIEVYNAKTIDQSFDSLYVDIDGTPRLFTNITINAQQTFVFGRKLLPWCDAASSVASALDLSSTGNWITLRAKNGQIIDRVIFTGGSNTLEWPAVSGKQSIELNAQANDAASNNFGRNWHATTTLIQGTTSQFGSPKSR